MPPTTFQCRSYNRGEVSWQNNKNRREHRLVHVNRQRMRSGLSPITCIAKGAIKPVVISIIGWKLRGECWFAERHTCAESTKHCEIPVQISLLGHQDRPSNNC